MNIREHSSQFTIYIFTQDVDAGAAAKVQLSQAGYDAYFFQDADMLEQRLRDTPPHILAFSTAGLQGALNDFVTHVLGFNDDIKFIAISDLSQFNILAQYNEHGFWDVISEKGESLDLRILWAVERICEKLYLTYQNEQLFDDLQAAKKQIDEVHAAAVASMKKAEDAAAAAARDAIPVSARLGEYRATESKEDLVQRYLNNISDIHCIYFKFLPSVRSFVATHANGIPSDKIQGVGAQLDSGEIRDLASQLALGLVPPHFSQVLVEAFHFNPPKILPVYANGGLEGVFVYSGTLDEVRRHHLTEEFSLFSLCYSHFSLEKKLDAVEVQDFVTDLFNRNYYMKTISEELERGRRLRQPLSVVKVAMDDFYEIESSLGEAVRDELLKSLASVITKTSRTNDVTCRTGVNEMAMILPHCSRKGAALRAERLRRIVEGTSFLNNGMKVSISLGISEFPTLCDSVQALDETATKALLHILDKGGNKICLFKAQENHKPEFEVTE
ncbi:GGDEF domain-containing protein [Bdellovibrio sp. HCB2-146]|uniref:GGDEF domain-containing protein n=1 Tax=Bdellovibrio sp. HCB2-146 TaxID=3394362 RepID=UPI0039BD5036